MCRKGAQAGVDRHSWHLAAGQAAMVAAVVTAVAGEAGAVVGVVVVAAAADLKNGGSHERYESPTWSRNRMAAAARVDDRENVRSGLC